MLSYDFLISLFVFAAANVLDNPDGDDEDKWTNTVHQESAVKVYTVVKAYNQETPDQ